MISKSGMSLELVSGGPSSSLALGLGPIVQGEECFLETIQEREHSEAVN